ncbi:O-antigen ligase family protein [bacterium]|nr:O-antigen ligase family protein [bacterium]
MNATNAIQRLSARKISMVLIAIFACIAVGLLMALQIPCVPVICFLAFVIILIVVIEHPAYLVSLLVITYPLEYSKTFFPFLLLDKSIDGASVSIIDLFRLTALLTIIVAAFLSAKTFKSIRPRGHVALIMALFILYYAFSAIIISSDHKGSMIELFRLIFNVAMCGAIIYLLNNQKRIELFAAAIIYTGFAIGLLSIFQYATGIYIWNSALTISGMNRVNATFGDPNILARFILEAFVFYLCVYKQHKIVKLPAFLAFPVYLLALFVTFSRSGFIGLLFVIVILGVYGVWRVNLKSSLALFGCLVIAGTFTLASKEFTSRIGSFSSGISAFGARIALINTAVRMFIDHPIFGVGINTFQSCASMNYTNLLPYGGNYVAKSHTSLLTIAAELGLVGIILTVALFVSLYRLTKKISSGSRLWFIGIASWVSILVILLSSQSEGRLLDDPMLFMLSGVIVAAYRNFTRKPL